MLVRKVRKFEFPSSNTLKRRWGGGIETPPRINKVNPECFTGVDFLNSNIAQVKNTVKISLIWKTINILEYRWYIILSIPKNMVDIIYYLYRRIWLILYLRMPFIWQTVYTLEYYWNVRQSIPSNIIDMVDYSFEYHWYGRLFLRISLIW